MTSANSENHPAPRIGIRLPVTLTFEETGTTVKGISENMSETGILVVTSVEPQPGGVADLEVGSFDARAELIWSKKLATDEVRLGMKFTQLGQRAQDFLGGFRKYLDDHGYRLQDTDEALPTNGDHPRTPGSGQE